MLVMLFIICYCLSHGITGKMIFKSGLYCWHWISINCCVFVAQKATYIYIQNEVRFTVANNTRYNKAKVISFCLVKHYRCKHWIPFPSILLQNYIRGKVFQFYMIIIHFWISSGTLRVKHYSFNHWVNCKRYLWYFQLSQGNFDIFVDIAKPIITHH